MRKPFLPLLRLAAAVAALTLVTGCWLEDLFDGDDGPDPVGAAVGGSWKGTFFNPETGERESISASIDQNADALVITTTKSQPPAQMFTGTINSNAVVRVTDAHDGETWTSIFGPVSNKFFKIGDFNRGPMAGDDPEDFPISVIELSR